MRLFLSIFLLITLVGSVTVVVIQQAQNAVAYEFKESKNDDDAEDSDSDELKETKDEKDLLNYRPQQLFPIKTKLLVQTISRIHAFDEDIMSSLYANLPDNPPEA